MPFYVHIEFLTTVYIIKQWHFISSNFYWINRGSRIQFDSRESTKLIFFDYFGIFQFFSRFQLFQHSSNQLIHSFHQPWHWKRFQFIGSSAVCNGKFHVHFNKRISLWRNYIYSFIYLLHRHSCLASVACRFVVELSI